MNKKIGFIGCGNMGSAMIGGMVKAGIVEGSNVYVADHHEKNFAKVNEFGVNTTLDNKEVAKNVDILFLSVKPYLYKDVISQIKEDVKEDVIIVAIAAGQSTKDVEEYFGRAVKVIKVMPNTPALVREAMSAVSPNEYITEPELNDVLTILNSFGKAEIVKESLMDAVTAVSGSSPAYVFMMIEAMADGAVQAGMPRTQAYTFAAQAVLGAAKMVLDTSKHPGALKDGVCSPGGTTIDAVAKLEETGFRNSIIAAMKACFDKSKAMSK